MVLTHDDKLYALSVRYDSNTTYLELLKETKMSVADDAHLYHLPVSMLDVDSAIKIDLNDPINSGLKIFHRLMNLRAFD
jgi:hypothetical protein